MLRLIREFFAGPSADSVPTKVPPTTPELDQATIGPAFDVNLKYLGSILLTPGDCLGKVEITLGINLNPENCPIMVGDFAAYAHYRDECRQRLRLELPSHPASLSAILPMLERSLEKGVVLPLNDPRTFIIASFHSQFTAPSLAFSLEDLMLLADKAFRDGKVEKAQRVLQLTSQFINGHRDIIWDLPCYRDFDQLTHNLRVTVENRLEALTTEGASKTTFAVAQQLHGTANSLQAILDIRARAVSPEVQYRASVLAQSSQDPRLLPAGPTQSPHSIALKSASRELPAYRKLLAAAEKLAPEKPLALQHTLARFGEKVRPDTDLTPELRRQLRAQFKGNQDEALAWVKTVANGTEGLAVIPHALQLCYDIYQQRLAALSSERSPQHKDSQHVQTAQKYEDAYAGLIGGVVRTFSSLARLLEGKVNVEVPRQERAALIAAGVLGLDLVARIAAQEQRPQLQIFALYVGSDLLNASSVFLALSNGFELVGAREAYKRLEISLERIAKQLQLDSSLYGFTLLDALQQKLAERYPHATQSVVELARGTFSAFRNRLAHGAGDESSPIQFEKAYLALLLVRYFEDLLGPGSRTADGAPESKRKFGNTLKQSELIFLLGQSEPSLHAVACKHIARGDYGEAVRASALLVTEKLLGVAPPSAKSLENRIPSILQQSAFYFSSRGEQQGWLSIIRSFLTFTADTKDPAFDATKPEHTALALYTASLILRMLDGRGMRPRLDTTRRPLAAIETVLLSERGAPGFEAQERLVAQLHPAIAAESIELYKLTLERYALAQAFVLFDRRVREYRQREATPATILSEHFSTGLASQREILADVLTGATSALRSKFAHSNGPIRGHCEWIADLGVASLLHHLWDLDIGAPVASTAPEQQKEYPGYFLHPLLQAVATEPLLHGQVRQAVHATAEEVLRLLASAAQVHYQPHAPLAVIDAAKPALRFSHNEGRNQGMWRLLRGTFALSHESLASPLQSHCLERHGLEVLLALSSAAYKIQEALQPPSARSDAFDDRKEESSGFVYSGLS